MTIDPVVWTPIVLCWAVALYRLPAVLRNPADRARRAHWVTIVCLAAAVTVLVPGYRLVNDVADRPNLARLLGHGLALCAACSVQAFFLHVHDPGRAMSGRWRRVGLLAAALASMTALFLLAPVGNETVDFTTRYAATPFVREYWLVFLGYLGLALVTVMRSSRRYAALADQPSLGLGLRITSAGALAGLAYVANQAAYILARAVDVRYPLPVEEVSEAVLALSTVLLVTGSTMPSWGPRVGLPWLVQTVQGYRHHRRLVPLWRSLRRSVPEIALGPDRRGFADIVSPLHVGYRLRRLVIEIRDGGLVLARYTDEGAVETARADGRAAGVTDEELTAYIEAHVLAEGQRRRDGQLPAGPGRAIATHVSPPDLEGEVAHLVRVARWHRRLVRPGRLLARLPARGRPVAAP